MVTPPVIVSGWCMTHRVNVRVLNTVSFPFRHSLSQFSNSPGSSDNPAGGSDYWCCPLSRHPFIPISSYRCPAHVVIPTGPGMEVSQPSGACPPSLDDRPPNISTCSGVAVH
ncbi:hypothetical protein DPEC_G00301450 [Dallia pectoralis]|uniref:Uncharacterized protein n=1 Tax=Dallia pectoralis TaxID=75939 RepID=A0ACC2FH33_DALPE|nr:hypothetical protein DPEC_G00301450 [Dallia pectoralis]